MTKQQKILKPCPFCGADKAEIKEWNLSKPTTYYVYCSVCWCETSATGATHTDVAISRWNRRQKTK